MRISSGKLLSIRGNCYLLCKLMHFVYMQLRQSRRIYRLNAHMNAASDNIWNTITGLQVCVCSTSNFCSMKYWGCHTIHELLHLRCYAWQCVRNQHLHGLLGDTLVDQRPPLQDAPTALTWLPDVCIGKMPVTHSASRDLLLRCKC